MKFSIRKYRRPCGRLEFSGDKGLILEIRKGADKDNELQKMFYTIEDYLKDLGYELIDITSSGNKIMPSGIVPISRLKRN